MVVELGIIIGLILLNGLFAGTEIAVLTLRRTRVAELEASGTPAAGALAHLHDDQERFLATVQVGITVISSSAAALGGARLARYLEPWVASVPGLGAYAEDLALALVVGLVAYLSLVLGELVPKSLALAYSERYALLVSQPMVWIGRIAGPAVWFLTASSNLVLRLFGDRTSFSETRISREEVMQLVEQAEGAGAVEPAVGEIASRALAFGRLDAADVMVPRREVKAVTTAITPRELATLGRSGHARMPVYEGDLDGVRGFVNLREALGCALQDPAAFQIEEVLREVPFVPAGLPITDLLRQLQAQRNHLAMVVDERGTVVGLVTIEDAIEELVGEIYSENDAPVERIHREPDGAVVVAADTPVHQVNRLVELSLPESEAYTTMAGLCLELMGRIPKVGETLALEGVMIEVVEATPRRVRRVRVRPTNLEP